MDPGLTKSRAEDFILIFTSILYEAMPFIVLGAVIAGILEEMVPQRAVTRFVPRNRYLAICASALLGLIFPMCECGIIPVMRRLLRKGLPLSCCTAYLLAGPIINFVVILSTFVAFSGMENTRDTTGKLTGQMGAWWMTCLRVGIGYLVAVGTSFIVEQAYRRHGNSLLHRVSAPRESPTGDDEDQPAKERVPVFQRIGNIAETALHDFVDITVFLILGALLAAFTRQMLTPDVLAEVSKEHWILTILAMMGLAVLLCLCSEADAFVAASFVTVRPAAKLAFLVLGPMLDIKLYLMYTRVFRPRLIWTIILAVVIQVFLYTALVHLLWENVYVPSLTGTTP